MWLRRCFLEPVPVQPPWEMSPCVSASPHCTAWGDFEPPSSEHDPQHILCSNQAEMQLPLSFQFLTALPVLGVMS